MQPAISDFSFWFALILSIGSLGFYFSTSLWNRFLKQNSPNQTLDFNLGIPNIGEIENLFSVALVAAGTSLSTVFVFFLTAGAIYGWWMVLSPVMFAVGNYVMYLVYLKIHQNGYFEESDNAMKGVSGLIPYIGKAVTGNNNIGWFILIVSILNLLAVLSLELIVGVEILSYLASHTLGITSSFWIDFILFSLSVFLLLGYVFVGGFRSVITSDMWQIKAMKWAIIISILSIFVFLWSKKIPSSTLNLLSKNPNPSILWGFIINVILANLFSPMSQESSWQRFRAFSVDDKMNLKKAINLSIFKSISIWSGLIVLAFLLIIAIPESSANLSSLSGVLESVRTLNAWWFPLFIFPILTVAGLSAMFSTADTCVSSLLYLIEYLRVVKFNSISTRIDDRLPTSYYFSMIIITVLSLCIFLFVKLFFNPTILQLVFSVFSNLVIIAPTVITAALFRPYQGKKCNNYKSKSVLLSLSLGFILFWASSITAIVAGSKFLWLSQISIVIGLCGSIIPLLPLWFFKRD